MSKRPRDPAADDVLEKVECPVCHNSGLTLTRYADGHARCYASGCGYFVKAEDGGAEVKAFSPVRTRLLSPDWGLFENQSGQTKRKLAPETLRKLGIFVASWKGQKVQAYPYFDMDGVEVAQKLRPLDAKDFIRIYEEGVENIEFTSYQLFGRHYFGDRYDRQVIVTEGELDAASVAQATDFKTAVVSVSSGADGAVKSVKANYLWLDRFDEIVLWFDNDEAGKKAAQECAALFRIGKVRIATAMGMQPDGKTACKDASDILQANRPGDIKACIYAAVAWRPKGIVNAAVSVSDVLAPAEMVPGWSYPPSMPRLQEMSGGMFPGDVTYHVAGTGVGKSTNIREIIYHLIDQGVKVCVMSFEDTKRDIKMGIMSIPASERLHLRPVPVPDDIEGRKEYDRVMTKWHDKAFGSGLVELFDPETAEWSMKAIMGYTRYAAAGLDCKVIVVEPLTFIAAGINVEADKVAVLDAAATDLAKNSKELGTSTIISHHLTRIAGGGTPHEEGAPTSLNQLRGSSGLAFYATGVVGWERNSQAEGEGMRVTQSRVLKPFRRTGMSGLADVLYYGENGRLIKSPIPFPPIGKPDGDAKGGQRPRSSGFDPVATNDY